MSSITVDPLKPEALEGLKDPRQAQEWFNRIQQETGTGLNGSPTSGLTAENFRRAILADKEVVTPDDWVRLEPLNGFVDAGDVGAELAVRKEANGVVRVREVVARPSDGFPDDGTVITELPPGYAPSGQAFIATVASDGPAVAKVTPTGNGGGQLQFRSGDASSYFLLSGSWVAEDRSLPPWPTPFKIALPASGPVGIRHVLVVARAASGGDVGLPVPATCYAPFVEHASGGQALLVLPRIDGLRPLTRYRLTLWAFLE